MNSKQKMLAAMSSGLDAAFPAVIPYVGIFLRDHWEQVTDQPWWAFQGPDLYSWLKVEGDLLRALDMDWMELDMCPSRDWRSRHCVETIGNSVFLVDNDSEEKKELPRPPIGGAHIPMEPESPVQSIDDVDWRLVPEDRESLVRSGKLDYARMVAEKFGSERFLCAIVGTPYSRALIDFFGFRGMMVDLLRRPKLIEEVLEKLLANTREQIMAYADAGLHGIFVEEALSSADVISPDIFKKFVMPYNREIFAEIRRVGMKSVYYPCGDMTDRLQQVEELDPDCISLEESKKGFEIDIAKLDECIGGRFCIFGNMDSIGILQNGAREQLRKEISRQVKIGHRHGKFVMSLGSPVTPLTHTSRVREYIKLVHQELE